MNKFFLPLVCLFAAAACSDKHLPPDIVEVFGKHGYEAHDPRKIREALRSGGAEGLKTLDRHAEVLAGRKKFRELPGGGSPASGLLLAERGGDLYLARVFKNSPGAASGLRDGDKVLEIDGRKADPGAVRGLARASGFELKVDRRSSDGSGAAAVDLKKEVFSFPVVFGFYAPEAGAAYVRIGLFYEGSGAAVTGGLAVLSGLGAKKVIFDLRDSAGGMPEEAAGLLEALAVKTGPVLEIRSRHKGYSKFFNAPGRGQFSALKPVVLVNSGTAMAAEAFAQALRELRGALIIGETTRGNVSLGKTFRLGSGDKGLKLTVARLYPPSGKALEEKGVEPDINIALSAAQADEIRSAWASSSETVLLNDPVYKQALERLAKY